MVDDLLYLAQKLHIEKTRNPMPDSTTTPEVLSRDEAIEHHSTIGHVLIQQPIDGDVQDSLRKLDRWLTAYTALLDAIEAIPPIVYEGIANRHKQIFPDEFEHFHKLAEIARQARRE